tara:strand:- start:742 stop:1950 length:1209 start_codon:yes stop_codon:yes gene_type:complete
MELFEAINLIKNYQKPKLALEKIPANFSLGRILGEDLYSSVSVPQYNNSAVDGYAIRYKDIKLNETNSFNICAVAKAGEWIVRNFERQSALRVFTGAPIPSFFDTIIMQEQCTIKNHKITINSNVSFGSNLRQSGEDIQKGEKVFECGHRIRSQDLGFLASVGITNIPVYRKLKVAIFSIGNEITEPGELLDKASRYDSNRFSLLSFLKNLQCDVSDLGILSDDIRKLRSSIINIADTYDIVISSGGVSEGDTDYVRKIIKSDASLSIDNVSIKPGKPILIGNMNDTTIIALPGNPVAMIVTFIQLARPLILRIAGATKILPQKFNVKSGFAFNKKSNRREFLRVIITEEKSGSLIAKKFDQQGSGILTSIIKSDGLIDLHENLTVLKKGDTVKFLPFNEVL